MVGPFLMICPVKAWVYPVEGHLSSALHVSPFGLSLNRLINRRLFVPCSAEFVSRFPGARSNSTVVCSRLSGENAPEFVDVRENEVVEITRFGRRNHDFDWFLTQFR